MHRMGGSPGIVGGVTGRRGPASMLVRPAAVALATLALVALALVGRADAFVYWTEKDRHDRAGQPRRHRRRPDLRQRPRRTPGDGGRYRPYLLGHWLQLDRAGQPRRHRCASRAILGAFGVQGVAVDSAHVYWTNSGLNDRIGRANLDGSAPTQNFINTVVPAAGVAVDGSHVYWANSAINTIGRANLDGSNPTQTFIVGADNPQEWRSTARISTGPTAIPAGSGAPTSTAAVPISSSSSPAPSRGSRSTAPTSGGRTGARSTRSGAPTSTVRSPISASSTRSPPRRG